MNHLRLRRGKLQQVGSGLCIMHPYRVYQGESELLSESGPAECVRNSWYWVLDQLVMQHWITLGTVLGVGAFHDKSTNEGSILTH